MTQPGPVAEGAPPAAQPASPPPPAARQPRLRTVAPFAVGLVAFALLAILNQARGFVLWRNYALTGVVLGGIVTWMLYRWDVRVPRYIQWVIVAGLLLHYGGGSLGSPQPYRMGLLGYHGINGAYHVHTWWDNLTHFVGVGAGTMATAYLLEAFQTRRGLHWRPTSLFAFAVTVGLAMGVGVELYEYLGKSAFQTIDQGGYENTMRDLHFNVLGAVLGGALAVTVDRRNLAKQIERHWGRASVDLAGQPWTRRVPTSMAAFAGFVAPAAGITLALSVRFLLQDPPFDRPGAYDDALQLMLASAVAGVLVAPLAGLAWSRVRRQASAEAGA